MDKPDVDVIEGLSRPSASSRRRRRHNPRSTVGTITEIHDHLRLLYARAGTPHCPTTAAAGSAERVSQMVDTVLALPADARLMILAPVVRDRKGEFASRSPTCAARGVRFRIGSGGQRGRWPTPADAEEDREAHIDVVVDRLRVRPT